ncbi:tyrosine-type recombinase/integrase (plasmid) [Trichlorobacter lovleyi]|uniref:tyrosine-type recombinase/integrase n=1 Tax=Trichlorobacter lovleyi TaxID=313985 RepID=UPI00223F1683|nr:tyrosine-type recombinase/integrase [Trichlorobacter lovleyi]QOX81051.1 tyrosine-type recombinase/integrase [Trichlorobacter lovleyi]
MASKLAVATYNPQSAEVIPALREDFLQNAADWFGKDVANGDACADTIKTYLYKLRLYFNWCSGRGLSPFDATRDDIKSYRQVLIYGGTMPDGTQLEKQQRSTIQSKLAIIRAFYASALSRGLVKENPAAKILAPRNRSAQKSIKHYSPTEVDQLKSVLPQGTTAQELRDFSIFMLCMVEGVRRVSVSKANVEDIEQAVDGPRILVHGKGKDYHIYPSAETMQVINQYLDVSGLSSKKGTTETPLFMSFHKGGQDRSARISRNGVSDVVNRYLMKAGIKTQGRSVHALRHTCGFYVYQLTKDVKMVQQVLGHSTLATAAIYSHTEDMAATRITGRIAAFKNLMGA